MRGPLTKQTWEQFQASGLLWFTNSILHTFGWAIVVVTNDAGEVEQAFPALTRFRGFLRHEEDEGRRKLSAHMAATAAANHRDAYEPATKEPE